MKKQLVIVVEYARKYGAAFMAFDLETQNFLR